MPATRISAHHSNANATDESPAVILLYNETAFRALPARSTRMQIQYACLSVTGPVRPQNEDSAGHWEPTEQAEWRNRGATTVLADGVGGQDRGEVASQLACDTALGAFRQFRAGAAPGQLLFQMFNAANLAVYDAN